ncbi:hypothetical protein G9A89_016200 [Geosiphon pyriformis]|nr:hypothetical protein G9A89_016200 [Geosiphon pyriformis]
MTTTRAKSKKAAPDICPEISNKISTRRALSVVEATRQNVLEAFLLPSNHDKLPLVATKATSSSLAGFSSVKVPSKRHTWISPSVASTPTKSPNIIQHVVQDKLRLTTGCIAKCGVFQQIIAGFGSKTISSYWNWADQMETESSPSLVFGATSGGAWETITSYQRFAEWVAFILILGATFKIKLAHVKAVFQSVHGLLGAKSVLKDNVKLFCVEFASQTSLNTAFLVELTSSVCLATLKITKSLVVSKSKSPSATVVLCDVPLGVSAADIKTALSVFGMVTHVVLKPAGIWQYVVVHFEKLDSAILNSLEKQISDLAALVKSIVETVGFLIVLVSHLLDNNAVKTVQLEKNLLSMKYASNNFANLLVGMSKNIACLRSEVDFGNIDYDDMQAAKPSLLSENTVKHIIAL